MIHLFHPAARPLFSLLKSAVALLVLLLLAGPLRAQAPASVVGYGWARNAVNTVVFRKNSLVTFKNEQFTAFYDSVGYLVLAKRTLPQGPWQVEKTTYRAHVEDAHNDISLMVDGAGYLHVAYDHHNNRLHYNRGLRPGALVLTPLLPMTGQQEDQVSYPEFYRFPSGDLAFLYRAGGSGNGNLVMNRYDAKTRRWTRLHTVLLDGQGQRNAYWQAAIDAQGTFHLSWVWRETPDVATNHDLAYARSRDGGRTWQKSTGEAYALPITAATAEYALRIPQKSELINQTSMCADAQGRPYIATYWRSAGSAAPQYQLVYHDGKSWQVSQVGQRSAQFSLSGGGTKKIPIARPQVLVRTRAGTTAAYVVFRDAERGDKASLATCPDLARPQWAVQDLTTTGLGNWEPTYDTERWQQSQVLSLFIQRTGQGDGETLEALPAQPVSVLEWTP
ncbi:BNR repeat-containing protein [Hymenobacter coccineus]|uniref:BNR repeat-containing protein n=1 Tax=Hymenobacter coccineus TaxID=1908235 RepID=UPI0009F50398|nr:BNR repeat-containing protein [Hymenobacter coccineus]